MGDPVALLLAQQDVARQRGLLRVVREQVAQEQRRRAGRCARTPRTARAARGPAWASPATCSATLARPAARADAVHNLFTSASPAGNRCGGRASASLWPPMELTHEREVLRAGDLEVRPADHLALAAGQALALSVRELDLLAELVRNQGRIVPRDELYATVWGAPLRAQRPLRRRVRPQAAVEAGPRHPGVPVHPHALRVRLPLRAGAFTLHSHTGTGGYDEEEPTAAGARRLGRAGLRRRRMRRRRRERRERRHRHRASRPAATSRQDRDRRLVDGRPVRRGGRRAVQRGEPRRADHGRHLRHRRRLREVLRRRDRHLRRLAPDQGRRGGADLREGRRQVHRGRQSPTTASPSPRTRTSPSTA